MNITKEDKLRILARAFFTDNPDDYEDYHEALAEFMNQQNTSDAFVEFGVEPYIRKEAGHVVVTREDGHVATVRMSDGFFSPRTEVTKEEGEAIVSQFEKIAEEFPDLEGIPFVEKAGWKVVRGLDEA